MGKIPQCVLSGFWAGGYYSAVKNQTDSQLLLAYADQGSEAAFAELTHRYINLVYSAALRMSVEPHLAEDVAQRTFVALAKSARELSSRPVLSGWMHRTAQNIAAESIRAEVRRHAREQQAAAMNTTDSSNDARWEDISPHLDTAVGELSESDRDAVLLRYFENKSAREMAVTLGVSEEAAQKRVNRAVERLRAVFGQRGITLGAGALAAISANAIQAAPASLALTFSTAGAMAGISGAIVSAATTTAPNIALQTMTWINAKTITSALVTGILVGGTVYITQKQQMERLRADNQQLLAVQSNAQKLRNEAIASTSALQAELERLRKEQTELLRLRGQVAELRAQMRAANSQTNRGPNSTGPADDARGHAAWPPGTYITKDLLSPAGYDSPEAALQTTMYAMVKGTYELANESLAPQLLIAEPPTAEAKKEFDRNRDTNSPFFKGMQILARKEVANDRVELKVKIESNPNPAAWDEKTNRVLLQTMTNIGDAWKLGGSTREWAEDWDKEGNVSSYVK